MDWYSWLRSCCTKRIRCGIFCPLIFAMLSSASYNDLTVFSVKQKRWDANTMQEQTNSKQVSLHLLSFIPAPDHRHLTTALLRVAQGLLPSLSSGQGVKLPLEICWYRVWEPLFPPLICSIQRDTYNTLAALQGRAKVSHESKFWYN